MYVYIYIRTVSDVVCSCFVCVSRERRLCNGVSGCCCVARGAYIAYNL